MYIEELFSATFVLYFEKRIKFYTNNSAINSASSRPFSKSTCSSVALPRPPSPSAGDALGGGAEARQVPSSPPVTRSSAVLVACPDPLVALREYRPLLALVTAGIVSLARPSLKEICTPGRVEVEIAWPSLNQLTSGTGKPGAQTQFIFKLEWGPATSSALSCYVPLCLVLTPGSTCTQLGRSVGLCRGQYLHLIGEEGGQKRLSGFSKFPQLAVYTED